MEEPTFDESYFIEVLLIFLTHLKNLWCEGTCMTRLISRGMESKRRIQRERHSCLFVSLESKTWTVLWEG